MLLVFIGMYVLVKIIEVEVNKFGNELMLLGVEKLGNVDGSIFVWIGGIIKVFDGYLVGDYYFDFYLEDKVFFEIIV